jgi:hypothetical protein
MVVCVCDRTYTTYTALSLPCAGLTRHVDKKEQSMNAPRDTVPNLGKLPWRGGRWAA